ncbi:MAG: hypothetical protein HZB53_20480 [Chloroflexi bacterium]|nr:hypothetical protein [Chloroflexota bacterium]
MASISMLVPVAEDKVDHLRQWGKETREEQKHHHHRTRTKHGYKREKAWLHEVNGKHVLVVYLEADNLPEAMEAFMKSTDPHDVWMRKNFLEGVGHDPAHGVPPGAVGELVLDHEG